MLEGSFPLFLSLPQRTHFRALIIARNRALPCWDEPAVKASFTVEITAPSDLAILSNMPPKEEKSSGKVKTVTFEKSPVMSIYLLAWFIGDFEYVECKTERGVVVRVWTPLGKKETGTFACDCAARCLDFYEKYFEIEYPLPKCDMIACPDVKQLFIFAL